MSDEVTARLSVGPSALLMFPPDGSVSTLVLIEFLDKEQRWVRLDELHMMRRAFRFVPVEPAK
jgi:hypothetical protein